MKLFVEIVVDILILRIIGIFNRWDKYISNVDMLLDLWIDNLVRYINVWVVLCIINGKGGRVVVEVEVWRM